MMEIYNRRVILKSRHTFLKDAFDAVALEDIADGVARPEVELCFVAEILDPAMFARAIRVEQHEQYEIQLAPEPYKGARMRVRSTIIDGKEEITLTYKVTKEGERFPSETTIEAPAGLLELFRTLHSSKGMKKTRYVYSANDEFGEVWEVDVFKLRDNSVSRWCKVDYEFKGDQLHALPPIPEGLGDLISAKTTDPVKRKFVDDLFANVFNASASGPSPQG